MRNESRYIGEVLALCGQVYVFDDHSTDSTPAICESFGHRVRLFPSPFEGLDEARDKNYLLEQILVNQPEWVLWIDGDKVLEQRGPALIKAALAAHPAAVAFTMKIVYLWDAPDQVCTDGLWGRFYRPSLFRLAGQSRAAMCFQTTGFGGNLHCGNVPLAIMSQAIRLEVRLKHYGYLEREKRLAKYEWYRKVDPHNYAEDEYRHLAEIPGARHAPGPARMERWVE